MAVQKSITYVDSSGVLRTATITVDITKFAFGAGNDSEDVYLTVTAPGIPASGIWYRNIDSLVEDGLFASGIAGQISRYVPPGLSAKIANTTDLGMRFKSDQTTDYYVVGIVEQLKRM